MRPSRCSRKYKQRGTAGPAESGNYRRPCVYLGSLLIHFQLPPSQILSYLRRSICPEMECCINNYVKDIPGAIRDYIYRELERAGRQSVQYFYEYLMTTMAEALSQGLYVVGFKVDLSVTICRQLTSPVILPFAAPHPNACVQVPRGDGMLPRENGCAAKQLRGRRECVHEAALGILAGRLQ